MSTFRNPVGPQPSKVYWRRRLIVGLGLLAVIVVIVLIFTRPGSGSASGGGAGGTAGTSATPSSDTTPAADSDAAATGDPSDPCPPANIAVAAITDANSYAADVNPKLSLSLTNNGASACTLNAGSDVQEYRITSGTELIWSSKDCQSDPVPVAQVLEPGTAITTTPFEWARTRSSSTTCGDELPKVTGGGATYRLSVIVDGIESADAKRFVLN